MRFLSPTERLMVTADNRPLRHFKGGRFSVHPLFSQSLDVFNFEPGMERTREIRELADAVNALAARLTPRSPITQLRSGQGLIPFLPVSAIAATSAVNHSRIRRARAWLKSRALNEEVLIIGASLDAANELAREVAKEKGAAFGWHRLTLAQLASALAAPLLAERKLAPLSRLGVEAIAARVVHRLKSERRLGRYHCVGDTPGFARAIAAVIAELRLAKLTCDAISKAAPDLVPLIEAYEAALAEAGLTDWPGVLAFATDATNDRVLTAWSAFPCCCWTCRSRAKPSSPL